MRLRYNPGRYNPFHYERNHFIVSTFLKRLVAGHYIIAEDCSNAEIGNFQTLYRNATDYCRL